MLILATLFLDLKLFAPQNAISPPKLAETFYDNLYRVIRNGCKKVGDYNGYNIIHLNIIFIFILILIKGHLIINY